MNSYKKQSGFTLVELIVVIIILGILSATALPKFLDVTERAHYSAVAGAAGGLGAGVALFHAQWVANGHTAAEDDVAGFGSDDVDSNADGWPVSTNGNNGNPNATRCVQVWNGVMQNPPSAATAAGSDYLATASGTVCTYTYQLDNVTPARSIDYDVSDGAVTSINSRP